MISCLGLVYARNELTTYMGSDRPSFDDNGLVKNRVLPDAQPMPNSGVQRDQDVPDVVGLPDFDTDEPEEQVPAQQQMLFVDEEQDIVPEDHTVARDSVKLPHDADDGHEHFDEFAPRIPPELQSLHAQKAPKPTRVIEERSIEFNFEGTDLQKLVDQVADIFDVVFIVDDAIEPLPQGGKVLKGNKISFKTQKPLSRQEAWNLFVTFLDLAGFALTPEGQPRMYHIKAVDQAIKSPLPSYIGVHPDQLPDSDEMIRYIYFIKNSKTETIKGIVESFKSTGASLIALNDLRAFVLTDKAYNVRSIMNIVKEVDKAAMPQAMSVLKLKHADAVDVQKLYKELVEKDDVPGSYGPRTATQRKQPTTTYFPDNAVIIAEPRSNALIILGPKDVIKKVEDFVKEHVDIELDQPYSPLFTYQVKYADARSLADVMREITKFGSSSEAGKHGGVRGGDKFIKQMAFTPEVETNQIIIKGDYEDYLRAKEVLDKLDEPQPQVAIEVLLLSIDVEKSRELGVQLRSKVPGPDGLLGKNVNFQTSGIKMGRTGDGASPIIPKVADSVTTGAKRLLGNLMDTVLNPSIAQAGTTVVNFGADVCGVWGIFNVLDKIASTEVISNPFLVATNKTEAEVKVGQTRRVNTSDVITASASNSVTGKGDFSADLTLKITPQINSDGMIVLNIYIGNEEFFGSTTDPDVAAKSTRTIDTKTILADQEILAIGGLLRNSTSDAQSKVPILGDIPVLGWLFKNKSKVKTESNVIALISVRIVKPEENRVFNQFTQRHKDNYYNSMRYMDQDNTIKDPVSSLFFRDKEQNPEHAIKNLIFSRSDKSFPEEERNQEPKRKRRSAWARKRGRRKQVEEVQPARQKRPERSIEQEFNQMIEKPIDQMLAKNTSVQKTSGRRSLTGFFSDEGTA